MILVCGIPSESPVAYLRAELDKLGVEHVMFNQRRFEHSQLDFSLDGGAATGRLQIDGESFCLEDFCGVYTRMMDDQRLPELTNEPAASARRSYCRNLHDALYCWYEIATARVVNRSAAQATNFSKPFQAQLIREQGFAIPETLITNDPELVRAFIADHDRVVYKSISGVRSIVQTFEQEDLRRLERIRWCPVQFQAYVEGTNVRVHTVGEEVFATAVLSDVTDYRYAERQNGSAELRAIELDDGLAERCVRLAGSLALPFAGIDLKLTPSGEAYCFEVNPSPAFAYYESGSGQPIAASLARYLADL
jgi:ribosomal protein S6-L-glutamate ligase RimK-like protein